MMSERKTDVHRTLVMVARNRKQMSRLGADRVTVQGEGSKGGKF